MSLFVRRNLTIDIDKRIIPFDGIAYLRKIKARAYSISIFMSSIGPRSGPCQLLKFFSFQKASRPVSLMESLQPLSILVTSQADARKQLTSRVYSYGPRTVVRSGPLPAHVVPGAVRNPPPPERRTPGSSGGDPSQGLGMTAGCRCERSEATASGRTRLLRRYARACLLAMTSSP